jgi:hypothetical protein
MTLREPFPAWYHQDNLFDSQQRMDEVHHPIVDAALRAVGPEGGDVVDLGCGNAALLRKIVLANPKISPWGIEREPERIAHAQALLPAFRDQLVAADLFGDALPFGEVRFALGLISPRRYQDAGPERLPRLRAWIRAHCDALLVYGYGRALSDEGGLAGLCQRVGIRLADESDGVRVSLAVRY